MYSAEKSVQLLIALMKAHGIRRVIASPGSTNICLVVSLQNDPFFEMYSCIDERSAAYMACGLSAETGEPVALTCTEATASRNYLPGLTEAFYRKLPVLAITATNHRTLIGQNQPQMMDRSVVPADAARKSVRLPVLRDNKEVNRYAVLVNDAILELTRNGGGPVHIEYETEYSRDYSVEKLPDIEVIRRVMPADAFPTLDRGPVAVYVGAHRRWDEELTQLVDSFCERYDAVVLTDHIGNYHGKYGVPYTLVTSQQQIKYPCCSIGTLIYIGDISSAYAKRWDVAHSWRVNPDGKVRNVYGHLEYVFQMEEKEFFRRYTEMDSGPDKAGAFRQAWRTTYNSLSEKIPELPFSDLWVAQNTLPLLPEGAPLFLGIENTLRCWNFFKTEKRFDGFCNTGGFGIDGGVSALVGASLADRDKIYYGVMGDLGFFYDMNALGNRHVGKNVRLMIINNGLGQQFKNPAHPAFALGDDANKYVAAAGHYGDRSRTLVKGYAESLGYTYLSASDKDGFLCNIERFVSPEMGTVIFEIFTDTEDETQALRMISGLEASLSEVSKGMAKKMLGESGMRAARKILGR